MIITPNCTIHFIGIGGSGMSAIARIAIEKGYRVSGSDLKESVNTVRLKNLGARVFYEHVPANIREADLVVASGAISMANPEYEGAVRSQIPVYTRAQFLGFLMDQFPKKISVAGTHGKTTTTSLTTRVLEMCGTNPTYLIGADMNDFGGNAGLGQGAYFVAESDESDGSFLQLNPNIAIITNIEPEHMNYFKTEENLMDHFNQFIERVLEVDGYVVVNRDDERISKLTETMDQKNIIYYGLHKEANLMAKNVHLHENGVTYDLVVDGKDRGEVNLQVLGRHNAYNSLAAIGVGLRESLPLPSILQGLSQFSGTRRRMQLIGDVNDIRIYDDYGHHPTEIKATLEAAKQSFKRHLICIFQPHRYTRTQSLLNDFPLCFDSADRVIITDIYSSGEDPIDGVSSQSIITAMQKTHSQAEYIANKSAIPEKIMDQLKPGDMIVTMGAGDIHTIAKEISIRLKSLQTIEAA